MNLNKTANINIALASKANTMQYHNHNQNHKTTFVIQDSYRKRQEYIPLRFLLGATILYQFWNKYRWAKASKDEQRFTKIKPRINHVQSLKN